MKHLSKIKDILDDYKTHLDRVGPLDDKLYIQKQASVSALLGCLSGIRKSPNAAGLESMALAISNKLTQPQLDSPFNGKALKDIFNERRTRVGWHDTGRAVLKGIVTALAYMMLLPAALTKLITNKSVQSHLFPVKGREVVKHVNHEINAINVKLPKSRR